jgi:hypothetical protein
MYSTISFFYEHYYWNFKLGPLFFSYAPIVPSYMNLEKREPLKNRAI